MLNRIVLMGRMVREPELRRTAGGVAVTNITLAVDRDYKTGGEKETDYVDVVIWRSSAEFVANYGAKGRLVVVEGNLASRKWTDKNGQARVSWEVQSEHIYFADSRKDSSNTADESEATPGPVMQDAEDEGNLPF